MKEPRKSGVAPIGVPTPGELEPALDQERKELEEILWALEPIITLAPKAIMIQEQEKETRSGSPTHGYS